MQAAMSVFGAVACYNTSILGTYGLLAYEVSLREKEIGIRLALGSSRERIVRLLLYEEGRWLMAGTIPGTGLRRRRRLCLSIAILRRAFHVTRCLAQLRLPAPGAGTAGHSITRTPRGSTRSRRNAPPGMRPFLSSHRSAAHRPDCGQLFLEPRTRKYRRDRGSPRFPRLKNSLRCGPRAGRQ